VAFDILSALMLSTCGGVCHDSQTDPLDAPLHRADTFLLLADLLTLNHDVLVTTRKNTIS